MEVVSLIGYILSFLLQAFFLIYGVFYIIKHPFKMSDIQEKLILSFIFMCFLLNALEKLVYTWTDSPWFYDVLPFGNMSPVLFTLCFIGIFLPKNIRKYIYAIFILLMIGMAGAGLKNGFERTLRLDHDIYTCILFDCYGHTLIALFAFYLLRNGIVEFNKKEKIFAIVFCFACAVTALILNAIFDTEFFGLNLNGRHQIYHVRISENSYISALCYFAGLTVVVVAGAHTIKLIKKYLIKDGEHL